MKRRFSLIALLALSLLSANAALGQDKWPDKPVKLVVPYPPGGISDALGRYVARILEKDLGQTVVVENRGGAGSNIGSEAVAKSPPDGYTILLASTANAVNMSLYKNNTYNTSRDLAAVSLLADVPNVLVVASTFPVKSVSELIAYSKKNPDEVAYASAGAGSPAHLAAELFNRMAGIQMRHIPYKGAGPAMIDVVTGRVPVMLPNLAATLPGLQNGSLKLLGTGGTSRLHGYPNVPTIAEAGVAGYSASAWYGLMVPAGTPPAIIARLQRALAGARTPEATEFIRNLGADPVVSTPEELKKRIDAELASYAKLIMEAKIAVD